MPFSVGYVPMMFSPLQLLATLQAGPPVTRYVVAYSGGCDSTVLLHAMSTLVADRSVTAIHVNHGWHDNAEHWACHCQANAQAWGLTCQVLTMVAHGAPGRNREAVARVARYALLQQQLAPGEMLLTAHHREDQAETLLLQMLRGAGANGLAAMPLWAPCGEGAWHGRPMLQMDRAALREYASHYDLNWIEDPSNSNTHFDRNYVRHRLWPTLSERWPSVATTLSRVASLQAENSQLLAEVAAQDLTAVAGEPLHTVSLPKLLSLSRARQRNVLRHWLAQCGLPAPAEVHLTAIERDVVLAREDATPRVTWPGACVQRYRTTLYATPPLQRHDATVRISWDMKMPLHLAHGMGTLQVSPVHGGGLKTVFCHTAPLTVRFRIGGERCRPLGSAHTRELKKLFQEWGVPPWLRSRTPLIFIGEQLAQVVGYTVCEFFAAQGKEPGLLVEWKSSALE